MPSPRTCTPQGPAASQDFTVIGAEEFASGVRPSDAIATLYLPGLEALGPPAQVRLLRSLQSLGRTTRIILASCCDLKGMASTGRLRADLYERVGTLQIHVAPLAERLDDIPLIAQAMLQRRNSTAVFTETANARLREHVWHGNLRELWNLCERMAPIDAPIEADDLDAHLPRRNDPPAATPA